MDISSFEVLVKSEKSTRRHLVKSCWKNHVRFCISCRARKVYRIRRFRYRCSHCGYEFSDFTGRWIGRVNITARRWLWLIKLFELEISARKIYVQLGLSYPTVIKAFNIIRQSIIARTGDRDKLLGGEIEADETYFGG